MVGDPPFFVRPLNPSSTTVKANPLRFAAPPGIIYEMSYVRYVCEFCNHEVQPGQSGTMKLVLAWVRSDNNTGIKGVKNQHKYAHSICVETETKRGKQEGSNGEQTLF